MSSVTKTVLGSYTSANLKMAVSFYEQIIDRIWFTTKYNIMDISITVADNTYYKTFNILKIK